MITMHDLREAYKLVFKQYYNPYEHTLRVSRSQHNELRRLMELDIKPKTKMRTITETFIVMHLINCF